MNKLKAIATSTLLLMGITTVFVSAPTLAVSLDPCSLDPNSAVCGDNNASVDNIIQSIVNILLFIIAAVSVIVIIIGGIMYSTSGGEQARTKKAKDAILYAIVGLVVAIFAFVIVNWVVNSLLTGETS